MAQSCAVALCRLRRGRRFAVAFGKAARWENSISFCTWARARATTEKDATYLIKTNYEFTKDLAVWVARKKNAVRLCVVCSDLRRRLGRHGKTMTRSSTSCARLNMYGYSKHLFDLHAKRAGFLNKIVGLTYFNVFGPNEDHKGDMRSLVHKVSRRFKARRPSRCSRAIARNTRTANRKRDFLYVKDGRGDDVASGRK